MTLDVPPSISFTHLCRLLQARQAPRVLSLLESAGPSLRPAERRYLRLWAALQQARWDALAACLRDAAGEPDIEDYRVQTRGMTQRRRQAWLCWLLGRLAAQLERDEDAFGWYTRCLSHLGERRMNHPLLRVRALCGRGAALLRLHAPQAALAEYDQASAACQNAGVRDQLELAAGLCDVYTALGNLEQALVSGQQALALAANAQQECALRGVLGSLYARQGQGSAARACYLEALETARACRPPDHSRIVTLLLGLADLQRQEGNVGEARACCEQAWSHASQCPPGVRGALSLACADLARAEEEREEARRWYTAAAQAFSEAGASAASAEAHRELARLSEAAGELEQATLHWKEAYQAREAGTGE